VSEALAAQVRNTPSRREPPYRPAVLIGPEERERLADRLGDAANNEVGLLREMVLADPENVEFRKSLLSAIDSAELVGIDAFSRKVCDAPTVRMLAHVLLEEEEHLRWSQAIYEELAATPELSKQALAWQSELEQLLAVSGGIIGGR
jgi:hypothetical protein